MKIKHLLPILILILAAAITSGCQSITSEPLPDITQWPVPELAPAFVWENYLADNTIVVEGRSRPRRCQMASLTGRVLFTRFGQMDVNDGAFFADFGSGRRVASSIQEAKAMTFEATITPRSETGGWIAALDGEDDPVAFALTQEENELVLILGGTQEKKQKYRIGSVETGVSQHVAFTLDDGRLRSWINGAQTTDVAVTDFDPAQWEAISLVFGSSADFKHQWAGLIEGVAVYPALVDPMTLRQHAAWFRAQNALRPQPEPTIVKAELLAASQPPKASAYPRALVLYHYKIREVVSASLDIPEIMVYHWAILGGDMLPVNQHTIGETYEMKIEPYEIFEPVLQEEQRSEQAFIPGVPAFYDVSRP